MATNKYYSLALKQKAESNRKRIALFEQQKNEIYTRFPRISEIEREMSALGAQVAITALSGNAEKLELLKQNLNQLSLEKEQLFKKANLCEPDCECAVCNDAGMVKGEHCECVKAIAKQLMLNELSREMPINESSFDNFDLSFYSGSKTNDGAVPKKRMTQIFKYCTDYANNFSKDSESALFIGGTGLGKTHLSLAIVSVVAQKGYSVIYSPAQRLFDAIEKEHFAYTGSEDYLDTVLNTDLLVIDDLGTEFITTFTQAVIYNIINSRILSKKPTIINTNLSPQELESRYTARVVSRFIGNYAFKIFCGDDVRQQKAISK